MCYVNTNLCGKKVTIFVGLSFSDEIYPDFDEKLKRHNTDRGSIIKRRTPKQCEGLDTTTEVLYLHKDKGGSVLFHDKLVFNTKI